MGHLVNDSLVELVGLHECLVTAGLVALPLPEVLVDGLDVVPEGVDALQHLAALITGLQVGLLILAFYPRLFLLIHFFRPVAVLSLASPTLLHDVLWL